MQGILEKVWVKEIFEYSYKDTFNEFWAIGDLVTLDVALALMSNISVQIGTVTVSCQVKDPYLQRIALYVKESAMQGILEKVWVKETFEYSYKDTFNEFWAIDDLVTLDVALTLMSSISVQIGTVTAFCQVKDPYLQQIALYVKESAIQGWLEKVWIKEIFEYSYKDTLNEFWAIGDLVTLDVALSIISANIVLSPQPLNVTCRVKGPYLKRDYLYVKESAIQGKLEKVWVKREYINTYKDTFNKTWNKGDLIPYEIAEAWAASFTEQYEEELASLVQ